MSETEKAPERIWVTVRFDLGKSSEGWWDAHPISNKRADYGEIEYIRADLVQAKDAEIARLRADLEAMTALKRNYAEMNDAAELREAQARAQERARIVGILSSLPPAAFFPGCVSNLLAALTPPDDPAAKIGGE